MWLARIEKVNKLSRNDSEKSAMPGKQEKMIATPGHSTSKPTTVQERWPVMHILASIRIRITELEPTSIVLRTLIRGSATGLDGNSKIGVAKIQRQKLSYDSTANVWKSIQDNITFAPTTSCDFDNSSYSSTTFGGSGASITSNLESISNYLSKYGSQPTKPSPTLE